MNLYREKLLKYTKQMNEYLSEIDLTFDHVKETGEKGDFYSVVKPYADKIDLFAEQWNELALAWVLEHRPKNIYPSQLEAAKENMKEISIQAFYPQTSYNRFKHYVHSIHYILEKLITEVEKYED